jgi:hypothetical protein
MRMAESLCTRRSVLGTFASQWVPVLVGEAMTHPRFKFIFPGSLDEVCSSKSLRKVSLNRTMYEDMFGWATLQPGGMQFRFHKDGREGGFQVTLVYQFWLKSPTPESGGVLKVCRHAHGNVRHNVSIADEPANPRPDDTEGVVGEDNSMYLISAGSEHGLTPILEEGNRR